MGERDELAEAERHMRQISDKGDKFARWMTLVMAEYDRRGVELERLRPKPEPLHFCPDCGAKARLGYSGLNCTECGWFSCL